MPKGFDQEMDYTIEEFAEFDLAGRPFLSEQGNTVTRGFVEGFTMDSTGWDLTLRNIDYLDKTTRKWTRKRQHDVYTSTDAYFRQVFSDATRKTETHLVIGGYGFRVFVGPRVDAPWTSVEWADVLDTDCFHGGILGEEDLPGG